MYDSIPSANGSNAAQPASTEGPEAPEDQALLPKVAAGPGGWRLLAASIGLLADAYDIFAIDTVLLALKFAYGKELMDHSSMSLVASASLLGIIVGQLSFGFVADAAGRKWAFVATAGLTILGAAASAAVVDHPGFPLPYQLALCRLLLGLGIGGEYPLSASVTAEAADGPEARGLMLATVISMQGWGMLLSSLLALLGLAAGLSLEALWRLLLAFGALPSAVAFSMRWQLDESKQFTEARRGADGERWRLMRDCWPTLLGTSVCWLLMNVSLYSLGSFKSLVLHEAMHLKGASHRTELYMTCRFAALTSCFAIAGFAAALALVNRLGRFLMQLAGFACLALLFLLQAFLSSPETMPPVWVSVALLGLVFFFQNCGPNTTTYIVPAEAFPTLLRASCHGISAASGKVGAFLGTMAFPVTQAAYGMRAVYLACALTAALGAAVTYRLTPRAKLA